MAQTAYENLAASLLAELDAQTRVVDVYERYYFGDTDLKIVNAKWREVFGAPMAGMTSNWCELVVNAAAGRLKVEGFTFPSLTGADVDAGPDGVAEEIWETNGLTSGQAIAHTTAVYAGRAYALAQPPGPGETVARLTVEHPSQVYVRMDPANNRRRLAGVKRWWDVADDGTAGDEHISLFLPNRTYHLTRPRIDTTAMGTYRTPVFVPRTGYPDVDEVANELGVVPAVPLDNHPVSLAASPALLGRRLLLGSMSDLHGVLPLQDAITKGISELVVMGEAATLPLRWVTGVTVPRDPVSGEPLTDAEIKSVLSSLMTFPDKDTKVGQLDPPELTGAIDRHKLYLRDIGAITRTPPHYMLGDIVNISGDALTATETALSERIREKHAPLGGGWEQATRIACGFQGDTARFEDRRCKTSWANPEVRSVAQATDAASKLWQAGMLPLEMALELVPGMSAAKIERAVRLKGLPARDTPLDDPEAIAKAAADALASPPAPGARPFDQTVPAA